MSSWSDSRDSKPSSYEISNKGVESPREAAVLHVIAWIQLPMSTEPQGHVLCLRVTKASCKAEQILVPHMHTLALVFVHRNALGRKYTVQPIARHWLPSSAL